MNNRQKGWMVAGVIFLLLLIDQAIKLYVKLHFRLGESVEIFPWWQICFVENNGMAFGIEWFDKLFLTLFRMLAVGLLGWYLHDLIRKGYKTAYILVISLITAGALGNIIDCLFYGMIFTQSTPYEVAALVPFGQGYGSFFYGRVVDMLYFPLIHNAAGEVLFFRPVFNFADSCITVAVALILLFFRQPLNDSLSKPKKEEE
ncbi:MAG: lipoprotein signal peptidase [Bacteroidales bacterium]|nr:lipoprotein signal peptidase [Candidatus Colicola faecequi]